MNEVEGPPRRRASQSGISRSLMIRGDLADTPLVETVQLVLSLKRTGQIALERSEPRESAAIYVDGGNVVHAWCPPLAGSECFHRLLTWRQGRYVFIADTRAPERTIAVGGSALLLDGLRRLDELARLAERLPPRGTVLWRCRDRGTLAAVRLGVGHWHLLRQLDGRTSIGELLDADPGATEDLAELIRLGLATTAPEHGFLARIVLVQTVRGARQLDPQASDLASRLLVASDGVRSLRECADLLEGGPEDVIAAATYLLATRLAIIARGKDLVATAFG